jgi:hypothetical protein
MSFAGNLQTASRQAVEVVPPTLAGAVIVVTVQRESAAHCRLEVIEEQMSTVHFFD